MLDIVIKVSTISLLLTSEYFLCSWPWSMKYFLFRYKTSMEVFSQVIRLLFYSSLFILALHPNRVKSIKIKKALKNLPQNIQTKLHDANPAMANFHTQVQNRLQQVNPALQSVPKHIQDILQNNPRLRDMNRNLHEKLQGVNPAIRNFPQNIKAMIRPPHPGFPRNDHKHRRHSNAGPMETVPVPTLGGGLGDFNSPVVPSLGMPGRIPPASPRPGRKGPPPERLVLHLKPEIARVFNNHRWP
ncbi:uncharacterized protein LOC119165873 isoform X2 [Rhipicephalus microplus]|uniref:uncharacterized protein LOC119165873 isoform X2 n=1 Tax=Rhipicephalus microplus TaxID=6941 RepID=UPI003F6B9176